MIAILAVASILAIEQPIPAQIPQPLETKRIVSREEGQTNPAFDDKRDRPSRTPRVLRSVLGSVATAVGVYVLAKGMDERDLKEGSTTERESFNGGIMGGCILIVGGLVAISFP